MKRKIMIAPRIVSTENSNESCLVVSPKGDEMFFSRKETDIRFSSGGAKNLMARSMYIKIK